MKNFALRCLAACLVAVLLAIAVPLRQRQTNNQSRAITATYQGPGPNL